jgi:hypothetical protein
MLLLTVAALITSRVWNKPSLLPLLKQDLERNGIAHVNLEDWTHSDTASNGEWMIEPPQDHSCRNHVSPNLAQTMSLLGQWAAGQQFATKKSEEPKKLQPDHSDSEHSHDHGSLDRHHHEVSTQHSVPTEKICQNSFRMVSKNKEWILDQVETFSSSPDADLMFPSATFVVAKGLEDHDSVWIFTDSSKWHQKLLETTRKSDSAYSRWYIQAYTLYNNKDTMGNDFCNGMSMIMAMGGFQWSLFSKGDCLTYFVAPWKLNDSGKFQGAMVYSFLLALLTEGITSFQGWIRRFLTGKARKFVMAFLYAIQNCLGYVVMLIAMMYSIELLVCVLLGLMTGRALFPNSRRDRRDANRPRPSSTTQSSTTTSEEETPLLAGSASNVLRRRR